MKVYKLKIDFFSFNFHKKKNMCANFLFNLIPVIFVLIGIYRSYELYDITHYDEKCFKYEKIITDKIDLNTNSVDYFKKNDKFIEALFKKNHKCFFYKMNFNSHTYEGELKSEIIFKCYC
jgi:hypothetical protein